MKYNMYSLRLIHSVIVILIALNVGAEKTEHEPSTKAFVVKWKPLAVSTRYPYGKEDLLRTFDYEFASDDVSPASLSEILDKAQSIQKEQVGVIDDGRSLNLRVLCSISANESNRMEIGIGQFPEDGILIDGRLYQSESKWFIDRIEHIAGQNLYFRKMKAIVTFVNKKDEYPYNTTDYFPSGMVDQWFENRVGKHLTAMEEPSLYPLAKDASKEIYRFTLLPSRARPPVSIRIELTNKIANISSVKLTGNGEYEEHVGIEFKETDVLDAKKTADLINKIYSLNFTSIPTLEDRNGRMGLDGSIWIF